MKLLKSCLYLFFPLIVGILVGLLISNSINYEFLVKPPLAPPKIVFPIAWTVIYLLMGISYFLFQRQDDYETIETMVYYTQLFVNAMWSIIFFVWKWRFVSILWILLLDLLIFSMIFLFYKNAKRSAYLNIPYFFWSLFATYLTIGIYILN